MKRPLALIGFSYFFALTFLIFVKNDFLIYIIIALSVLFLLSLFFIKKNKIIFLVTLPCLIASVVYYVNLNYNIVPTEKWDDSTVTIKGEICDNPFKKESSYCYIIKIHSIDGKEVKPFKTELSSTKPVECEALDTITAKAYLFIPPESPGFNSKIHYRAKGIYLKGFLINYDNTLKIEESNKFSFRYFILKIREKLLSASKENLSPEYASVINGIMLGDKNDFPKSIKRNFDIIGAYHLLAVSGIHISIVTFFILKLLIILKVKDKIAYILTTFFVMFFVLVAGSTPSSIRAGIMMAIYLISLCIKKDPDNLTSIAIAVGLVCLFNPNAAGDIGLWLSFLSILSIALFYVPLKNFIMSYIPQKFNNSIIYFLVSNLAVSICCFILNVPISSWYFKKISTVSFISNIFLIMPVSVLLSLSLVTNILTCINSYIFKLIIKPLAFISGLIIRYIDYMANLIAKIPHALINSDYGYLKLSISLILILVIIVILSGASKNLLTIFTMLSINLVAIGIISYEYFTKNTTLMNVIACGTGLAIKLSKNHHEAFILSTTEKTFIEPIEYMFSTSNQKSVDYVDLSMQDQTDTNKIVDIINTYEPKNIILNGKNRDIYDKINKNIKKIINKTQSKTTLFNNVEIETKTKNNYTYILIRIDKINLLIIPDGGDANDIPKNWIQVDFLICTGLPQNYKKIKYKNIIITNSKKSSQICLSKLANDYKNIFSSYYQGNIYINVSSNNNEYQIRRIM